MLTTVSVVTAIAGLTVLLLPRIRTSVSWRAMVTPLASIVGSGFLVVVPLLGHTVGRWAWPAIAAVVAVAYATGAVIRYNIRHVEPLVSSGSAPRTIHALDELSDVALCGAYAISVVFYLRLLSAFLLRGLGASSDTTADVVTTVLLLGIGVTGKWKGLHALERLEQYSVSVKLAIIGALLVALGSFDGAELVRGVAIELPDAELGLTDALRVIAGMLLIVQGFETSRYLGEEYDVETRIRTMRAAQIVSGLIYLVFVAICLPLLDRLPAEVSETAIIDLASSAVWILGPMLILAAIMSQFSAAVADTVGAGGLLAEAVGRRGHITSRDGYLAVALVGVILVWSANIFELISLASRAFAIYYALQAAVAFTASLRSTPGAARTLRSAAFALMALVLAAIALLGTPAG